jgi:hypothetical protein
VHVAKSYNWRDQMCEYFWFAAGQLNILIDHLLLGAHANEANSTIDDLMNV